MSNLKLRVGVISAKNLAAADKTGFSDPYAVVRALFNFVVDAKQPSEKKYTTKVVKQDLNPVWNFEFDIPIQVGKVPLLFNVTVWDKDTFGRDFLGEVTIPFKNCFDRNALGLSDGIPRHYNDPENKPQWFSLNKRMEKNNVSGDIQMKFGFMEEYVRDPQQYIAVWQELTKGQTM